MGLVLGESCTRSTRQGEVPVLRSDSVWSRGAPVGTTPSATDEGVIVYWHGATATELAFTVTVTAGSSVSLDRKVTSHSRLFPAATGWTRIGTSSESFARRPTAGS